MNCDSNPGSCQSGRAPPTPTSHFVIHSAPFIPPAQHPCPPTPPEMSAIIINYVLQVKLRLEELSTFQNDYCCTGAIMPRTTEGRQNSYLICSEYHFLSYLAQILLSQTPKFFGQSHFNCPAVDHYS